MRWMEVNNMCKILVTDGMNKNAIDTFNNKYSIAMCAKKYIELYNL